MISHIHHINFIVRNLESAVAQYQKSLGLNEFTFDDLDGRAVRTARTKLGDTWLVLVQPTNNNSVPARFLDENGEGFFLMSLSTDDLDDQLKNYADNNPKSATSSRRGLENWYVSDLSIDDFFGVQIQLTQEKNK